ncbi:MAG: FtsX-like permease family protein, partial [Chthoniobacterales bacterium]
PEIFEPYLQSPRRFMSVVVRTAGEPTAMTRAIREQVLALDRNQPVFEIQTMEQRIAESVARSRFAMLLLAIFAGLALALAAIGIYGVMACLVSQRRKEIGIRIALGASRSHVVKLVVREGMMMAALGLILGLLASIGLTRIIANLLFGIAPNDGVTLGGVSVLLALVAFLACCVPARRASRVDPIIALRSE